MAKKAEMVTLERKINGKGKPPSYRIVPGPAAPGSAPRKLGAQPSYRGRQKGEAAQRSSTGEAASSVRAIPRGAAPRGTRLRKEPPGMIARRKMAKSTKSISQLRAR